MLGQADYLKAQFAREIFLRLSPVSGGSVHVIAENADGLAAKIRSLADRAGGRDYRISFLHILAFERQRVIVDRRAERAAQRHIGERRVGAVEAQRPDGVVALGDGEIGRIGRSRAELGGAVSSVEQGIEPLLAVAVDYERHARGLRRERSGVIIVIFYSQSGVVQPIGEIERTVAQERRIVKSVASFGRVEESLVAGHAYCLCQQIEKSRLVSCAFERYAQLKVADRLHAELVGGHLAVYYALCVLYDAEAQRFGRTRCGGYRAPERKDKIRRRDAGVESLVYVVAEYGLECLFHYDPACVLAELESIGE